jgi:hypothetical protein
MLSLGGQIHMGIEVLLVTKRTFPRPASVFSDRLQARRFHRLYGRVPQSPSRVKLMCANGIMHWIR